MSASANALPPSLIVPAFSVVALSLPATKGNSGDFVWVVSPTSATVTAGQSTNFAMTLTPIAGFNQTVSLSCSGAPVGAACSPSPASVTLDGTNPGTVNFTVTTTARTATAIVVPSGKATWLVILALLLLARNPGLSHRISRWSSRLSVVILATV